MQVPLSIYLWTLQFDLHGVNPPNHIIQCLCKESQHPKWKKFSHICLSVRGHHHQVLKNISSYPIPEYIGHVLTTSFPSTISLISSMSRVSYFISPSANFVTFSLFFISTFFVLLYDSCKIKKKNTWKKFGWPLKQLYYV